jgi:hypothetical protein
MIAVPNTALAGQQIPLMCCTGNLLSFRGSQQGLVAQTFARFARQKIAFALKLPNFCSFLGSEQRAIIGRRQASAKRSCPN